MLLYRQSILNNRIKVVNINQTNNKMQPLGDFIFLEFKKEEQTKKGVILADVSKSKPATAKVVAVGPGRLDRLGNIVKTILKVGDTVVIDPFLPRQVKVNDKEYLIMREPEIYAKL